MEKNKKLEKFEREIARLMAFIEDKGGIIAVSKKIRKPPQFLYNIRDRRSFISAENLKLLLDAYPDFSSDWLLSGRNEREDLNVNTPILEIEKEVEILREQLKSAQSQNAMLKALAKSYAPKEDKEMFGNFSTAVTVERLCDHLLFHSMSKSACFVNKSGKMVA